MKRNQLVMEISNSQLCAPFMISKFIIIRHSMIFESYYHDLNWSELINIHQLIYWFWLHDFLFYETCQYWNLCHFLFNHLKIYNLVIMNEKILQIWKKASCVISAIFCEQTKKTISSVMMERKYYFYSAHFTHKNKKQKYYRCYEKNQIQL